MGPMSYEGKENYIFVSYAHRDSPRVLKILEELSEQGYRLWYDDGIAPGSEWPEDIAAHLDGCALVMAFISNNSMASANCRREVTFALSRHKPFLGIVLEETQMSLGMEMQLSAQQCILRYNYHSEQEFLRKILTSPDIRCCRIPDSTGAPASTAPAEPARVPVVSPQPAQERKPARLPREQKAPRPTPSGQKSKKPLVIGAALAALAAVAALAVLLLTGPVTLAPDVKVDRDAASVSLRNLEITADTVEKLNTLKKLNTLYIHDCTQEGNALGYLALPNLKTLTVTNTPLRLLSFLDQSPQLSSLELTGCGLTDEMLAGASLPALSYLVLGENPGITVLPGVPLEKLRSLDLSGTSVSDISGLASATELRELNCARTAVSAIEVLAPLEHLTYLNFDRCPISRVDAPFMSLSLRQLHFDRCRLAEGEAFRNLTVLERVNFSGNPLSAVDWLEKSAATLTQLDLADTRLEREDLAFLPEAVNLTRLDISGIPLGDAGVLKNLTQLKYLYATGCGIGDITPLAGMTQLKELYLDKNQITSLEGFPELREQSSIRLNLAYNQITDIFPLTGKFYAVALLGNPVELTGDAFRNWSASFLALDYHASMEENPFRNITRVYMNGCPTDRQLAITQRAEAEVEFLTGEEIHRLLTERDLVFGYSAP